MVRNATSAVALYAARLWASFVYVVFSPLLSSTHISLAMASVLLYYCAIRGIPTEVAAPAAAAAAPAAVEEHKPVEPVAEPKQAAPEPTPEPAAPAASGAAKPADDDDVDLFGSDDEDDAAQEALREKFLAESEAKKKAKGVIAKSSILFDVKPLDDETDMAELERRVREIALDGLEWKAGKLEDVAYGIQKLVINCHVEDDKVSTDILEEKLMELEDLVQSVDVAAFNKVRLACDATSRLQAQSDTHTARLTHVPPPPQL